MAEHYHTVIIPARPSTPRDKAIVENAVLIACRWIVARLLKQKCYSLAALNQAIASLLTALNQKPFQKRQERAKTKPLNFEYESHQTHYNPATGLPMIGVLDSMGNSFGSSASDRTQDWHHDYYHHHSTYTSSYDPFTNRY